MKRTEPGTRYYFVDEAGDPNFFGRGGAILLGTEGCSPILALGFAECTEPRHIRQAVGNLRRQILDDPYFRDVPSIRKTAVAFHAKDDVPEVRHLVFKTLVDLEFKVQVVVGRKILRMFSKRFCGSKARFYDDLVSRLFENVLHRSERNVICFSARSSKARAEPYLQAIRNGIARFEAKWDHTVRSQVDVMVQRPREEPCLQVVDYALWAVYRAFTRGEMRFFESIRDKFSLIVDLYDRDNYPRTYYDRENNPFHAQKISPL